MTVHLRKLIASALALACALAIGVTGVTGVAQATSHHHHHHHHHHGGIPQHNGGDHDADNNGGPSDGDGNL